MVALFILLAQSVRAVAHHHGRDAQALHRLGVPEVAAGTETGFFFQPCKSLAGSDSDDGVLCRETVVDLCENFLIKLRLYCKNDSFCRSDYFIVIQSGDNTKSFFTARSAFVCKVGNNDLVL